MMFASLNDECLPKGALCFWEVVFLAGSSMVSRLVGGVNVGEATSERVTTREVMEWDSGLLEGGK
jgi:hypothetical protein